MGSWDLHSFLKTEKSLQRRIQGYPYGNLLNQTERWLLSPKATRLSVSLSMNMVKGVWRMKSSRAGQEISHPQCKCEDVLLIMVLID